MKYYSVIRGHEYEILEQKTLHGEILDVGGSRRSGYHQLIKGDNKFYVINIDESCEPDEFVDIEKDFPFESNRFDNAICFNVIEHVFEFENVFRETLRCVKPGGKLLIAAPFMHHVHGSPDDFLRYTDSSYRRLAEKYNCEILQITPLGYGFFSLGFQCAGGAIPTKTLQAAFKFIAVTLDKTFNKMSRKYRTLTERLPLGYFVEFKKKND